MADGPDTPAQRFAAAAFYAPIGLGARLVDEAPSAVGKAQQQVRLARFLGKMVVDQGLKELRGRLADTALSAPSAPMTTSEPATPSPDRGGASACTDVGVDAHELALPDYDHLAASHIVGKLAGLTSTELDAIEDYELAHRHRRTVLGKIAQLRQGAT